MRRIRRYSYAVVSTCLCLLLLSLVACGNEAETPAQNTPAQKVDQQLRALADIKQFSGVVLMAQNDKVELKQAYGQADNDKNTPNAATTKFRIGALTQEFTAVAILQLQDQNKLKTQDKACKYITDCPTTWQEITIEHLLANTGGLKGVSDSPDYSTVGSTPQTPDQLLALLKPLEVASKSGTAINANGSDYILLSAIIENVSGETYTEYIKKHVLDTVDMQNSGFVQRSETDLATGYHSPGIQADAPANVSVFVASQGLYSTVEDLYKWSQALRKPTIISQAALDELLKPHGPALCPTTDADGKTSSCRDSGYPEYKELKQSYAWRVGTLTNNQVVATDVTASDGFYAAHTYLQDKNLTVIVLSNIQDARSDINGLAMGTMLDLKVS